MKRSAEDFSSPSASKASKTNISSLKAKSNKVNETIIRLRPIFKHKEETDVNPVKVVAVQVFNSYYQKEIFQAMQGNDGLTAKLLFKSDEVETRARVERIFYPGIQEESVKVKKYKVNFFDI